MKPGKRLTLIVLAWALLYVLAALALKHFDRPVDGPVTPIEHEPLSDLPLR